MQREIEATSTGERLGSTRDRSGGGGRNRMNDPEKGRINYGAEGLDKSLILKKRYSQGFEQSLTEAWNSTNS